MTSPAGQPQLPPCAHEPQPYAGPSRAEVIELRRRHLAPVIFTYYKEPLPIVAGHRQYLFDDQGNRYLDAAAGIATVSVGHCHPHVTQAAQQQLETLVHTTTIYLHPNIVRYAQRLAEHFPADSGLEVCYFTNSGSESNEVALLMARMHTGAYDVITLRNGYHGGSATTMGMTAMSNWKYPLPQGQGVHYACPGYCYRCPKGLTYPECGLRCAHDVASLIDYETPGKVAAFVAEAVQGVGGVIEPPPEYFRIVYDIVRSRGGVCIADEVQCGFGRTGDHFWGFEHHGVVPDLVTLAKGMGNGAPLGGVVARADVAAEMAGGALHFNTFGGNPVCTAQGFATLEVLDNEKLQDNARVVGAHLRDRLLDLQRRHALIGDVRGRGLMQAIELVRDRDTKEPAREETVALHEDLKNRRLLTGKAGVYGNILRFTPPLCVTREDIDFLADTLDAAFEGGTG